MVKTKSYYLLFRGGFFCVCVFFFFFLLGGRWGESTSTSLNSMCLLPELICSLLFHSIVCVLHVFFHVLSELCFIIKAFSGLLHLYFSFEPVHIWIMIKISLLYLSGYKKGFFSL